MGGLCILPVRSLVLWASARAPRRGASKKLTRITMYVHSLTYDQWIFICNDSASLYSSYGWCFLISNPSPSNIALHVRVPAPGPRSMRPPLTTDSFGSARGACARCGTASCTARAPLSPPYKTHDDGVRHTRTRSSSAALLASGLGYVPIAVHAIRPTARSAGRPAKQVHRLERPGRGGGVSSPAVSRPRGTDGMP